MNRRGFFKRTIGAIVGASMAPLLATRNTLVGFASNVPHYKGHSLVYDKNVPANMIYYINPETTWASRVNKDWMKR